MSPKTILINTHHCQEKNYSGFTPVTTFMSRDQRGGQSDILNVGNRSCKGVEGFKCLETVLLIRIE